MATARDRKKAEFATFVEEVRSALAEAQAAAKVAYDAFMKDARLDKDGFVVDACGSAWVVVYTPSYRMRTALKSLGEIERGYQGGWWVSNFTKHVQTQSITAHEKACNAARDVLHSRFPEDGQFNAPSRID